MISVPLRQIKKALDFLARMGLSVRDDPKRVIDPAARVWGDPVDGFALSIDPMPDGLSVVIRNIGTSPRTLVVPGWLSFFRIEMEAPLTPFGRELLKPERQTERVTVTLAPGELAETQIPLGALFALREKASYKVRVSCTLPDGNTAFSNFATITA